MSRSSLAINAPLMSFLKDDWIVDAIALERDVSFIDNALTNSDAAVLDISIFKVAGLVRRAPSTESRRHAETVVELIHESRRPIALNALDFDLHSVVSTAAMRKIMQNVELIGWAYVREPLLLEHIADKYRYD